MAGKGSKQAAMSLVLPMYEIGFLAVAAADVLHCVVYGICGLWDRDTDTDDTTAYCAALHGVAWGGHHFVLESIAFMLLHQGAGTRVTRRVAGMGFGVALLTTAWQTAAVKAPTVLSTVLLQCSYEVFIGAFYFVILVTPNRILFRRPAMRIFAPFNFGIRVLNFATYILIGYGLRTGYCVLILNTGVFFSVVLPFVVYHTFRRDSWYWQGVMADTADPSPSGIVQPLLGNHWGRASVLALHTGLDRVATKRVSILNFGFLSLGENHQVLGAGGTARVFRGAFKGRPVAVKMMFCVELDAALVRAFCDEAGMLHHLRHPNVVRLEGLCVVPPALCLVMELCAYGSLFSFLRQFGHRLLPRARVGLAADCCRAVAFMHTQDPPLLHMDIKSLNFLVAEDEDAGIIAKVSDLGQSQSGETTHDPRMFTPNWAAPEVYRGEPYTAASDCYALAMVLWEVYTARVPFDDPSARQVLSATEHSAQIEAGHRPDIPASVPAAVAAVIRSGWAGEPSDRPTAREMCDRLVAIREEMAGSTVDGHMVVGLGSEQWREASVNAPSQALEALRDAVATGDAAVVGAGKESGDAVPQSGSTAGGDDIEDEAERLLP